MSVQLNIPRAPHSVNENGKFSFLSKTANVGLKTLSVIAIATGTFSAVGGAVILSKFVVASVVFSPLFSGGVALAVIFLCLSAALSLNKYTRYGLVLTLPSAAFCAGFPFLIPVVAGSLPGIGLVALGVKGLSLNLKF